MIQLPWSAMIHSPVKHLQLLALPAWLLVPLQSRGSSPWGRETSAWLSFPWLHALAPVLQPAENPTGRKCSGLSLVQPRSSFPKQGIPRFYFSLCPNPGLAGCYFGLKTSMEAFFKEAKAVQFSEVIPNISLCWISTNISTSDCNVEFKQYCKQNNPFPLLFSLLTFLHNWKNKC